ncbi:hypothetical protein PR048_003028 [Dryococelus australis]|uniref:Uncharacterized protein n=1 Tax=Dryococelus australis TaxID=614101 RepID=A0ABQ9ILU1_9NEOP|nr:hypothetical protein PR048_003028 [Dryococelus australis]
MLEAFRLDTFNPAHTPPDIPIELLNQTVCGSRQPDSLSGTLFCATENISRVDCEGCFAPLDTSHESPPLKENRVWFPAGSPTFAHVRNVADVAFSRRIYSGHYHLPGPCIPPLLHFHLIPPSQTLKTSPTKPLNFSFTFQPRAGPRRQSPIRHIYCVWLPDNLSGELSNTGSLLESSTVDGERGELLALVRAHPKTGDVWLRSFRQLDQEAGSLMAYCNFLTPHLYWAAMAERLTCSPPTKANRVQSPARSFPDFRMWETRRTMPLVGKFSPDPSFRLCSIHISITLIGSQDLSDSNPQPRDTKITSWRHRSRRSPPNFVLLDERGKPALALGWLEPIVSHSWHTTRCECCDKTCRLVGGGSVAGGGSGNYGGEESRYGSQSYRTGRDAPASITRDTRRPQTRATKLIPHLLTLAWFRLPQAHHHSGLPVAGPLADCQVVSFITHARKKNEKGGRVNVGPLPPLQTLVKGSITAPKELIPSMKNSLEKNISVYRLFTVNVDQDQDGFARPRTTARADIADLATLRRDPPCLRWKVEPISTDHADINHSSVCGGQGKQNGYNQRLAFFLHDTYMVTTNRIVTGAGAGALPHACGMPGGNSPWAHPELTRPVSGDSLVVSPAQTQGHCAACSSPPARCRNKARAVSQHSTLPQGCAGCDLGSIPESSDVQNTCRQAARLATSLAKQKVPQVAPSRRGAAQFTRPAPINSLAADAFRSSALQSLAVLCTNFRFIVLAVQEEREKSLLVRIVRVRLSTVAHSPNHTHDTAASDTADVILSFAIKMVTLNVPSQRHRTSTCRAHLVRCLTTCSTERGIETIEHGGIETKTSDVLLRKILPQLAQQTFQIRRSCRWPTLPSNLVPKVIDGQEIGPGFHATRSWQDITRVLPCSGRNGRRLKGRRDDRSRSASRPDMVLMGTGCNDLNLGP